MLTPYLIQRMNFRKEPNGPTIDGILQMDYMGSAEFEWGALPTSLKFMCKNFRNFKVEQIKNIKNLKGKCLYIISDLNEADLIEYTKYIQNMIDGKQRLKECIHISSHVKENTSPFKPSRIEDAWWDIDNNLMFCFTQTKIEEIKKAIEATIEKKKAKGSTDWYSV